MTSFFLEKIRVKSCEITKLPLTRSLSFSGHEASRLDRLDLFTVMHLWDTSLKLSSRDQVVNPRCYYALSFRSAPPGICFRLLLQNDTKLLLRSETPTYPQPKSPNSPNFFTGVLHTLLRDLQGDSSKKFCSGGSAPSTLGKGGSPPPYNATAIWPRKSTRLKLCVGWQSVKAIIKRHNFNIINFLQTNR